MRRHLFNILVYYIAIPVGVVVLVPLVTGWEGASPIDYIAMYLVAAFTIGIYEARDRLLDSMRSRGRVDDTPTDGSNSN